MCPDNIYIEIPIERKNFLSNAIHCFVLFLEEKFGQHCMMSEENKKEESNNKNPNDLNESNEDGEILTLSDLLNEQREIDEVCCSLLFLPFLFCESIVCMCF